MRFRNWESMYEIWNSSVYRGEKWCSKFEVTWSRLLTLNQRTSYFLHIQALHIKSYFVHYDHQLNEKTVMTEWERLLILTSCLIWDSFFGFSMNRAEKNDPRKLYIVNHKTTYVITMDVCLCVCLLHFGDGDGDGVCLCVERWMAASHPFWPGKQIYFLLYTRQ